MSAGVFFFFQTLSSGQTARSEGEREDRGMTEAEKECVRDRETRDQRTTNQTSEWNHHLFITNCSYNSRKRVHLEEQNPNYSYTEHYTLNTSSEVKVTVHQNLTLSGQSRLF